MPQDNGSFGSVTYDGNSINIEINPDALGSLALTASDGRIECYWDGVQWVCNSIGFASQSQGNAQAAKSD